MKLSTQILLAFSLVLALSVIDSVSNYLLSLKVKQNSDYIKNSQAIIRNSGRLQKSMIEMESSFNGYLATKDTNFLENYYSELATIPEVYGNQKQLVNENERQPVILDSILLLHNQWLKYSQALIKEEKFILPGEKKDSPYNKTAEAKLTTQYNRKLNEKISNLVNEFNRIEYTQRALHNENLGKSISHTHTNSIIFLSLTIVIGIASTAYIVSLISKRIKTMVTLAESISQGNFTTINDQSKDELTRLSNSLNIMSDKLKTNISELEKRNTELDKFAYEVSHDLKAPLRGIHNAIKWIEEDLQNELSPELRRYLDIIPERTKRMENLINGLLQYAKIGKATKLEPVDVKGLVNEIVSSIVPRDFSVQVLDLPIITTERLKLEQVFSNLISNAVKYTPQENGKIIISCSDLPGHYQFTVKDNGPGIEAEYHEKIFGIFQTLREKGESESTGIGLAIVKKILDDLHCTIRIDSVPGKGAAFIFTWPKKANEIV